MIPKSKRGRKIGSGSFAIVPLKDLNSYLRPEAFIVVSLKWANHLHIKTKPINGATKKVVDLALAEEPLNIQVTNFQEPLDTH